MKNGLLAAAIVLGIGMPLAVLGVYAAGGWHLPGWLAITLPIILFGSVRGTAVLFGWKALRWSLPKMKARWRRGRTDSSES
ncbi:MAG TPA: hypothetical protein VFX19_09840 [Dehalococcoidia bacterium]|jgi:hypothetical protein|nr:hypothetical protein [Dehalococcoidia bacterium]